MPIGTIAAAAGVTVATVRYYDELGLVEAAGRVGGKRRFTPDAVGRVNFIRRAQRAGFDLDEIKLLLDDDRRTWPELVASKIVELEARRAELDTMIDMLREVSDCGCAIVAACPRLGDSQPEPRRGGG